LAENGRADRPGGQADEIGAEGGKRRRPWRLVREVNIMGCRFGENSRGSNSDRQRARLTVPQTLLVASDEVIE